MTTPNFYKQFKDKEQNELNAIFLQACLHKDIQKIDYLLSSPDLTSHADIHAGNDQAFITACTLNHTELVTYLIFKKNIDFTPIIEKYLEDNSLLENVWEMFYDRDKAATTNKKAKI